MTKVPISASTPTGADRPAAAPEPALDDERLDEGFLQLDLGFRWTRYLLGYLPYKNDASRGASEWHRELVQLAERLFKESSAIASWPRSGCPGCTSSLVKYRRDPQNWRVEGWTGSQRWTDFHQKIRQRFLQGVDQCRRKGESLSEATLRRLLGTGPPPGHEPPGATGARADHLLDEAARARAWLGQAAALATWRSQVPTLVDRFEKGHRLRDNLGELATALDQSCRDLQQDKARTGSRLDWAGRFRKHHAGLEAIRKQLEAIRKQFEEVHSALGGQAEALLAPLNGFDPFQRRTLEDVLARQPDDWPPRVLVELAQALDEARVWTGRNPSGANCWMIRLWQCSPLGGSHGPPDTARRLLALTVLGDLDRLDSEAPLTAAAWAVAEKWLGLLLQGPVRLVREDLLALADAQLRHNMRLQGPVRPTAWVRVPPSWLKPDGDPLLRVLADEEPTLLRLWQLHLRSQDSPLAKWVRDLFQSQGAKFDDLTSIEVFEGLVREVQALEATSFRALKALAPDARRIAQAVRKALRDQADAAVLGVPLTRDLRIDFKVLALPSGCRVEIDWEEAPGLAASPEVVDFKFARDLSPGWLRLRPGRDVPRATLAWARLPEPVAGDEPVTAALLGDLPAAYRRAPWGPLPGSIRFTNAWCPS